MKAKIAEEFYQMAEWLRTKDDTEEVLNDFIDRELGDILSRGRNSRLLRILRL